MEHANKVLSRWKPRYKQNRDPAAARTKGVKQQDGVVDFVNREIEVECLPGDIPEHIDVDISELMLHQGIRVRDLPTNDKWKPVSEPDMMIVHVVTVKVEETPAPAEAAA